MKSYLGVLLCEVEDLMYLGFMSKTLLRSGAEALALIFSKAGVFKITSIFSGLVMLVDMICNKAVMTNLYQEDMISSHQSYLVSHMINNLQNNQTLLRLSSILLT